MILLKRETARPVMYKTLYRHQFRTSGILFVLLLSFVLFWTDSTFAKNILITKEPDLCYKCHEELKENLSNTYTHFLFKQGKCSSCHNPHASDHRGLILDEINTLCLDCHTHLNELLKKTNMHSALKRNTCTDCHYAHSGQTKHLLTKATNKLCWDCHENLMEDLSKSYIHPLFEQGECSSCHNSHASPEENLLRDRPNATCKKCHGPRCSVGEVSITSVTSKQDCVSCHTGHSSKDKGLLGPRGHTAFLEKSCEQCHEPFIADKRITTKIKGKNLCFNCHERETPTQFIDDDIHVKDAENPCLVCHGPHASENEKFTLSESTTCSSKCHENTEKRTAIMEKLLKTARCSPIKERQCFECHMAQCSSERPLYYSGNTVHMCVKCHKTQHKTTHPIGKDIIDHRTGQPMTCLSCHSMHSAGFDFMLTHEGDKALCIQCHKVRT
jgi:predicted CXXCH cytochrome family protein